MRIAGTKRTNRQALLPSFHRRRNNVGLGRYPRCPLLEVVDLGVAFGSLLFSNALFVSCWHWALINIDQHVSQRVLHFVVALMLDLLRLPIFLAAITGYSTELLHSLRASSIELWKLYLRLDFKRK